MTEPAEWARVEGAKSVEDLFGPLSGCLEEQLQELQSRFHQIIQAVHPDKYPERSKRATTLFLKVTSLRAQAELKIHDGSYGRPEIAPKTSKPFKPMILHVGSKAYKLFRPCAEGDIADLFYAEHEKETFVCKISRSEADNDLLENEKKILEELYPAKQAEDKFFRYLPRFHHHFRVKEDKSSRAVNILQAFPDFYSLEEIQKVYPDGLDFKDVIWMWKRSLAALGFVHRKGIVHGAVLPTHILVHPKEHGARLVDWCYAQKTNHVRALSRAYRDFYPPEVLQKKVPTPATDIFMLAKTVVAMLGGHVATGEVPLGVPKRLRLFLSSCLLTKQSSRPDDAWTLLEELDILLKEIVGERKYRKLVLPKKEISHG